MRGTPTPDDPPPTITRTEGKGRRSGETRGRDGGSGSCGRSPLLGGLGYTCVVCVCECLRFLGIEEWELIGVVDYVDMMAGEFGSAGWLSSDYIEKLFTYIYNCLIYFYV